MSATAIVAGFIPLAAWLFGIWVGRRGLLVTQRLDQRLSAEDDAHRINSEAERLIDDAFDDGWPNKSLADYLRGESGPYVHIENFHSHG